MSENQTEKVFCNECSKETLHKIICSTSKNGSHEDVWWTHIYEVLECGGCEHVTFRKRYWFSEWQDPAPEAEPLFRDTYFPPPLFREEPAWFETLDEKLCLSGKPAKC